MNNTIYINKQYPLGGLMPINIPAVVSGIGPFELQGKQYYNKEGKPVKANGGQLNYNNPWNSLSMTEKADVMKIAIDGGVYDLDSIRSGYNEYAKGGKIHIDPSKKGTFTAAASKHGMGVQQFASKVLTHPENYSPAMRKKANFARNFGSKKKSHGG